MPVSNSAWGVLIADDEPRARRGVRQLLGAFPEFAVVGECRDGAEVLASLDVLKPDVVFLDVQMPGIDAFEVVRRRTPERMPAVVFLTAYDQFAIRAFEAQALDYLVKPVTEAEVDLEHFGRAARRPRFGRGNPDFAAAARGLCGGGESAGTLRSRPPGENGPALARSRGILSVGRGSMEDENVVAIRVAWLVLSGIACAASQLAGQDPVPAPQGKTYKVSGAVTDSARAAIAEAEVTLIEAGAVRQLVVTGADGHFVFVEVPVARLSVRVRRLGYESRVMDVQVGAGGQPTFIEIVLAQVPAKLEDVVVDADLGGRLHEFYQRREQRKAFARFLVESDIRRLGPTNASDLFHSVPGIAIRAGATGNTIRIRNCQPTVWLDGQRIPGAELDEVARPGDIAAIEFYPSSAGIPAQYTDRSNRLCGLILVWMKSQ